MAYPYCERCTSLEAMLIEANEEIRKLRKEVAEHTSDCEECQEWIEERGFTTNKDTCDGCRGIASFVLSGFKE